MPMVVFSQRCLPLTSNLKESADLNKEERKGELLTYQWETLLSYLKKAVRTGEPSDRFSWDYDYESLWSPKLRDPMGHKINPFRCSGNALFNTIKCRTHWFKRLPLSGKNRVRKLCENSSGRRKLRDCLNTVDGVMTSLIFSFPELFITEGGYTASDRITNSIILNCFHNYDRFQKKLKKLRKSIKHAGLNHMDVNFPMDELRDMSYFVRPIQILNSMKKSSSKSKMFRVAMISQTRATGLAGSMMMKESVEEFLNTVTVKREFEPDELMVKCIEEIQDGLSSELRLGMNSEFKVSMSTAACRESPARDEGKFGYLKKLVEEFGIEIPKLSEGIPGTLGNWLWPLSKRMLDTESEQVKSVNVAAIRENGKARVVTSGSFWKDVALQPFSHITIHLIKTLPDLRSGLKAGRLGWRFIEKIWFGSNSPFNWMLEDGALLYSSDLEKATDKPTHAMARLLVGGLLRKCGLDDESLAYVLDYWVGDKTLYYQGKNVGTLVNGIPMGDPLTKTCLSLSHVVADLYARYSTGSLAHGEGNGDDVIRIVESHKYVIAFEKAMSMLGYDTSYLDTALSRTWGTYCEEFFYLPTSHVNTVQWGNRFQNSLLLPYLDIVKLRTVIATEKDREDFSSNPSGKVTLMGHDAEYFKVREPGPHPTIFAIASGMQDVNLDVINSKDPLYLPRQVNGVGRAPPYWSKVSWLNILKRCRPWHRKYYLTVMRELNKPGTSGVSRFKGTLKESKHFGTEMYVEHFEIPDDDPIRTKIMVPFYEWDRWEYGVLEKLINLGYLIPESKIAKYYLFQERLEELETSTKRDLFARVREELDPLPDPDPSEEKEIVGSFINNYRDAPYRIKRSRAENLYAANAVAMLEKGNPLVVEHPFPLIKKFGKREKPLTIYDRQGFELYTWFISKWAAGRERKAFRVPPPQHILEDDNIIIQRIADSDAEIFCIITDDVRLYRLALNKFPSKMIWRMSVYHYLQTNTWLESSELDISYDDYFEATVHREFDFAFDTLILQDLGSTEAFVAKFITKKAGVHFETIGIPWKKDIKAENLERKPLGQSLVDPGARSLDELSFPRQLCTEADYSFLIQKAKDLAEEESSYDDDSDA